MAAVSVSTLRTRVATAIDAVTGFTEASQPYGIFGRDPGSVLHKRFCVGAPSTDPGGDRQRVTDGMQVNTTIAVVFTYRLSPKDQITDYGSALDAEEDLIQAVMAQNSTLWANCSIRFGSIADRRVEAAGEWFTGEIRFVISHRLPLS